MSTDKKIETETHVADVAGDYGFRIRWEYAKDKEYRKAASFVVWQVVARQPDGLKMALFLKEGGSEKDRFTPFVIDAEPYLSGCVHQDGRIWFTGSSVMNGVLGVKKHLALTKYLWLKAHEFIAGEVAYKNAYKEWKQSEI